MRGGADGGGGVKKRIRCSRGVDSRELASRLGQGPGEAGGQDSRGPVVTTTPIAPAGLAPATGHQCNGLLAAVHAGRDDHRRTGPGVAAGTISWEEHLRAYSAYRAKYGNDQSAERIAERGGFGYDELIRYLGHEPKTWSPR